MIELTERARSALRDGEVLVFDWTRIALCCATAGEPTLRSAPLHTVKPKTHRQLPVRGNEPRAVVFAHFMAYPHLAPLDITIDHRRTLGMGHFVTDLAPDFGLRAALGRPAPVPAQSDPPTRVVSLPTEVSRDAHQHLEGQPQIGGDLDNCRNRRRDRLGRDRAHPW